MPVKVRKLKPIPPGIAKLLEQQGIDPSHVWRVTLYTPTSRRVMG